MARTNLILALCTCAGAVPGFGIAQEGFLQKLSPTSEGAIKFGLFYDSVEQGTVSVAYDQKEIFGTDDHFILEAARSAHSTAVNVSSEDADIFESIWSRRFSFASKTYDANSSILRDFEFGSQDFGLSFSRPVAQNITVTISAGLSNLDFSDSADLPLSYVNSNVLQNDEIRTVFGKFSAKFVTLQGETLPMSGSALFASAEIGRASDIDYLLTRVAAEHFIPLKDRFFTRLRMGASAGFAQGDEFPFNKNSFAGGAGSVRGYTANSLGPFSQLENTGTDAAVGGRYALTTAAEFGMVFGPEKSVAAFVFLDAGNASDAKSDLKPSNLAKSRGIGLRWQSPLGPLEMSYAQAISPSNPNLTDEVQLSFGRVF